MTHLPPLYSELHGLGDQAIVLHGGPGLGFGYLLPWLSIIHPYYETVYYDQRGTGRSLAPLKEPLLDLYVADLEIIRATYGFEKPWLIAHSWGGFLAASYAARYPKSVKGLILMSCVPLSSQDYHEYKAERAKAMRNQAVLKEIEETTEFQSFEPNAVERYYRELFRPYFYDQKFSNQLHFEYDLEASRASFSTYALFQEKIMSQHFDLYEELAQWQIPTLVIHGEEDPILLKYVKKIPHADLEVIPKCGHFPFLERPEKFLEVITA